MAYTYILTNEDLTEIAELRTKKEVTMFLKDHPNENWVVSRCEAVYQYHVTYEHSHGSARNSEHSTRVFAHNAKEACQKVMENYYEALNALYAKRGTCKKAAAYGVRYPFHLHAIRMD